MRRGAARPTRRTFELTRARVSVAVSIIYAIFGASAVFAELRSSRADNLPLAALSLASPPHELIAIGNATVDGVDNVLDSAEMLFTNSFDAGLLDGVQNVRIDLPDGSYLPGRLYGPSEPNGAAIVMMHGCTGLWAQGQPWTVAQGAIEKWGIELARDGFVALAIDSYTSRTPAGVEPHDFQVQCAGTAYAGAVDPYTTRVGDMDTAVDWLRYRLGSAARRVGALGWSQGAESVLVRSAETYAHENASRFDDPANEAAAQLATVAFYPGCGANLGFVEGSGIETSYWRPHHDVRLNHGGADPLNAACANRAQTAVDIYGSVSGSGHWIDYVEYPNAQHSFDGALTEWPAVRCAPDAAPSDFCAATDADIDSLEFLLARLVPNG